MAKSKTELLEEIIEATRDLDKTSKIAEALKDGCASNDYLKILIMKGAAQELNLLYNKNLRIWSNARKLIEMIEEEEIASDPITDADFVTPVIAPTEDEMAKAREETGDD